MTAHASPRRPPWLRLPRRTARLRLTVLSGGLFLVSGVALLAATYVLFEQATAYKSPPLPKVPHTPSIETVLPSSLFTNLAVPKGAGAIFSVAGLSQVHQDLSQVKHELAQGTPSSNVLVGPPLLTQINGQLTRAQQQLAQGQRQLAEAVHQLTQVGPAQAAQRAADSHQLLVNSGIALAIVAVLALLAGWLVAGRMLRPIRTITRTARRISATNLHERLALDGPEDELKELGNTLDELFGRLDAAFDAQRHFVANASHELRTPLTAERTLLQVALDDPDTTVAGWRSTAEEVLASNDEQARLIEALLALASSESGLHGREPLDLGAVVAAALIDIQPEAGRLGISVEATTASARLVGDPVLVGRLVANLLTNAIRHNVAGGHVEVVTKAEHGDAVLSVTNTGAPIPATEVDRLFQPFQRLDPRRTHHGEGHGLGLSIVRAIASAHGASITADAPPDGGLSITVRFPRLAREAVPGRPSRNVERADLFEVAAP
jgi:signal transduction histidine kinase